MSKLGNILEGLKVNEESYIGNQVIKEIQKLARKYDLVASPSGKYDVIVSGNCLQMTITFKKPGEFTVKLSFHSTPTEGDYKTFSSKMDALRKEDNNLHYLYNDLHGNRIISGNM